MGNEVSLFDVGWYLDPNITGLPPPFEVPLYEDDLRDCQRYWYKAYGPRGRTVSTIAATPCTSPHPVPMRATPTPTLVGTGLRLYDGGVLPTVTGVADDGSTDLFLSCSVQASAGGITANTRVGGPLVDAQTASYIAVSARM